jgi:hypothetical protein
MSTKISKQGAMPQRCRLLVPSKLVVTVPLAKIYAVLVLEVKARVIFECSWR